MDFVAVNPAGAHEISRQGARTYPDINDMFFLLKVLNQVSPRALYHFLDSRQLIRISQSLSSRTPRHYIRNRCWHSLKLGSFVALTWPIKPYMMLDITHLGATLWKKYKDTPLLRDSMLLSYPKNIEWVCLCRHIYFQIYFPVFSACFKDILDAWIPCMLLNDLQGSSRLLTLLLSTISGG